MSINESWVWKQDLVEEMTTFSDRTRVARMLSDDDERAENLDMACEKFVFATAFVVRKLIESRKISDQTAMSRWPARRSPRVSPPRTELRKLKLLENADLWTREKFHYDLDLQSRVDLRPRQLCNLVIHSYTFLPVFDAGNQVRGFLVNSDRSKRHWIWTIDMDVYIAFLNRFAGDTIVAIQVDRQKRVTKQMDEETSIRAKFF